MPVRRTLCRVLILTQDLCHCSCVLFVRQNRSPLDYQMRDHCIKPETAQETIHRLLQMLSGSVHRPSVERTVVSQSEVCRMERNVRKPGTSVSRFPTETFCPSDHTASQTSQNVRRCYIMFELHVFGYLRDTADTMVLLSKKRCFLTAISTFLIAPCNRKVSEKS